MKIVIYHDIRENKPVKRVDPWVQSILGYQRSITKKWDNDIDFIKSDNEYKQKPRI